MIDQVKMFTIKFNIVIVYMDLCTCTYKDPNNNM